MGSRYSHPVYPFSLLIVFWDIQLFNGVTILLSSATTPTSLNYLSYWVPYNGLKPFLLPVRSQADGDQDQRHAAAAGTTVAATIALCSNLHGECQLGFTGLHQPYASRAYSPGRSPGYTGGIIVGSRLRAACHNNSLNACILRIHTSCRQ